MPALVDTSVLVAASIDTHPHFEASQLVIKKLSNQSRKPLVATHCLAEFFATLTSLPLDEPVTPRQAQELVRQNILRRFEVVPLEQEQYEKAMNRVAERSMKSGAIFDALILQAAIKRKATNVITWDLRHFAKLAGGDIHVVAPPDFK